jgi:hypothetical protein
MPLAGRGGSVKFSSSTGGTPALVGDLREWSLNVEADMFEVSTFGSSGWKEFQPNLNGASGSLSGYWNVQASTTMRAMQSHLLSQSTAPASIALLVDNTNANGYTADVWITSLSPGASVDAIVPFTANFTMHGSVAYSTTL